MRFRILYFLISTWVITSCADDLPKNSEVGDSAALAVELRNQPLRKGRVEGLYMPDNSEIGVFLQAEGGGLYDAQSYDNVKYTASGTESSQSWVMDISTPVPLSSTKGVAYAYYPWVDAGVSLTNVPITNDGTDWMYASSPATNISNQNNVARFDMIHAMTIIRCKVVRGNYSSEGIVHSLSVRGATLATGASLNLQDPEATTFTGIGGEIKVVEPGSIQEQPIFAELWAVPVQTGSTLDFYVRVDDRNFKVTTPVVNPEAGAVYNYTITVDGESLAVSSVLISDWRELTDTDLESKVDQSDYAVDWEIAKKVDGVYAITSDGKALAAEYVTDNSFKGIAFVLYGKAYQVAKNWALNSEGTDRIYWWKLDYQDIPSLNNCGAICNHFINGYLPSLDGSYAVEDKDMRYIDGNWNNWLGYDLWTALADRDGRSNTEKIIEAQTVDGVVLENTLAEAVLLFRANEALNEGYTDWFVPSMAQLAFMYIMKEDLNKLMTLAAGGTFGSSTTVWSSDETNPVSKWRIAFNNGYCQTYSAGSYCTLRLIREISMSK